MPPEPIPLLQDTRWLIATGMASAALLLSVYQQLVQYRLRHPKMRVLLQHAITPRRKIAYTLGDDPYDGIEHVLSITIKNYGYIEMTFEKLCCALEAKGATAGNVVINPRHADPELPATIKHGQNIKILVGLKGLQPALNELSSDPHRKVRLSVKDAIGRRFYSKWMELPISNAEGSGI